MIQSKFIKEFLLISNIYRTMNNILKEKLSANNIPINETQLVLLFLMHNSNDLTAEEMLKLGHFSTSNLLFNINTLISNDFAKIPEIENFSDQLDIPMNLSMDGKDTLNNIDKIFKNINTNSNEGFLNFLVEYENNIKNLSKSSRK
jgi:hypothetical protein